MNKFVGVYKQITTNGTGPSGTSLEERYDLSAEEFKNIYGKDFAKLKGCWEYLREKPKFADLASARDNAKRDRHENSDGEEVDKKERDLLVGIWLKKSRSLD